MQDLRRNACPHTKTMHSYENKQDQTTWRNTCFSSEKNSYTHGQFLPAPSWTSQRARSRALTSRGPSTLTGAALARGVLLGRHSTVDSVVRTSWLMRLALIICVGCHGDESVAEFDCVKRDDSSFNWFESWSYQESTAMVSSSVYTNLKYVFGPRTARFLSQCP